MPQAMKIPDAKAAVDKEWKKLETIPAWDVRKVKSKKEVIKEPTGGPLLSWLPRFAAQVMNKMRNGKDGKTSEMGELVEDGESQ